jgi:hypothetical protein
MLPRRREGGLGPLGCGGVNSDLWVLGFFLVLTTVLLVTGLRSQSGAQARPTSNFRVRGERSMNMRMRSERGRTTTYWLLGVAALVAAAVLGWYLLAQSEFGDRRGSAIPLLLELVPTNSKKLAGVVVRNHDEYRGNAVLWSAAYFGSLFGSAMLSALAALLLKLELLAERPALRSDLAAASAAAAALLITLLTLGDFQRKWSANRAAASAMENLAYDLSRAPTAINHEAIITRMQEINTARNVGIIGEQAPDKGEQAPDKGEQAPDKASE